MKMAEFRLANWGTRIAVCPTRVNLVEVDGGRAQLFEPHYGNPWNLDHTYDEALEILNLALADDGRGVAGEDDGRLPAGGGRVE